MSFDLIRYPTDRLIEAIHLIEEADLAFNSPDAKSLSRFQIAKKFPSVQASDNYLLKLFGKENLYTSKSLDILYGLQNLKCQDTTLCSAIEFLKKSEEQQKLFSRIYAPEYSIEDIDITEMPKRHQRSFFVFFSESLSHDDKNITSCFRKIYPLFQTFEKDKKTSFLKVNHLLFQLINKCQDIQTLFELRVLFDNDAEIEIKLAQRAMLLVNHHEKQLIDNLTEAREFINLIKSNENIVSLFHEVFENRQGKITLNLLEEKDDTNLVQLDVSTVLRLASASDFFKVLFSSKNFKEKDQKLIDIRLDFRTFALLSIISNSSWSLKKHSELLEVFMAADRFVFSAVKFKSLNHHLPYFAVDKIISLLLDKNIALYDDLMQKCLELITNPYSDINYKPYPGLKNLVSMLEVCDVYELDKESYLKRIKNYIHYPHVITEELNNCTDEETREKIRYAVLNIAQVDFQIS